VLFFLWVPSADAAVVRVVNRAKQGGHSVPEIDIRRRFAAGLRNFFELYSRLADAWWLYDGSGLPPRPIAKAEAGTLQVMEADVFQKIRDGITSSAHE
jgi:predicted ABC-type ATPase